MKNMTSETFIKFATVEEMPNFLVPLSIIGLREFLTWLDNDHKTQSLAALTDHYNDK